MDLAEKTPVLFGDLQLRQPFSIIKVKTNHRKVDFTFLQDFDIFNSFYTIMFLEILPQHINDVIPFNILFI